MLKILFICHGNICRSPMAEFVMKDIVRKAGAAERFYIESAATSSEELGNPVYPPVRRLLGRYGIDCSGKTARQITHADYDRFDLWIGMDEENLFDMKVISHCDPQNKIRLLLDFTSRSGSVVDPWYTRDFEAAWRDINEGCQGLLRHLCPDL